MSNQQEPPARAEGNIHIEGAVKGQGIAIGSGASAHASGNFYQENQATIDLPALQKSLMDLYENLGRAPMPLERKMALQLATGRAVELTKAGEPQAEALAHQIKQLGETFQSANDTIEQGSQLADSIMKVVGIVGPLVAGGARVAASWFGLHLPL